MKRNRFWRVVEEMAETDLGLKEEGAETKEGDDAEDPELEEMKRRVQVRGGRSGAPLPMSTDPVRCRKWRRRPPS